MEILIRLKTDGINFYTHEVMDPEDITEAISGALCDDDGIPFTGTVSLEQVVSP